ncbi:MAG: hypothetical protein MUC87_11730 [Bacteroidia bacterium]|jgi:hypothetical protein|nr:hypothetical protein [Bacteroidia bacterium]
MIQLPDTENPLVLQTCFDDEQAWHDIVTIISTPTEDEGFLAVVDYLSDGSFENLSVEEIIADDESPYTHTFIFIADKDTFTHNEYPLLCVDLRDEPGRSFRVVPAQVQSVENNLSIANMGFEDFADSVDEDGVFRGF